jgi:hypothetical protein
VWRGEVAEQDEEEEEEKEDEAVKKSRARQAPVCTSGRIALSRRRILHAHEYVGWHQLLGKIFSLPL